MSAKRHKPQFVNVAEARPLIVDLSKRSGSSRWKTVLDRELTTAKAIFDSAWKEFPATVQELADWFGDAYRNFKGPYQSELHAWAKAMGTDFGVIAMVNCAYELEQLSESHSITDISKTLLQKLFGCTAGVFRTGTDELVHVRNLDWPISGMGPATRVFHFTKGDRKFEVVGFPGFVGALSGMVPGSYSVTINWAPPQQSPSFDHAPAMLLRRTLEECDTYQEAAGRLKASRLSTSVFFTVCGAKEDEGCVIERTPTEARVRKLDNGLVVQSNHHVAPDFLKYNDKLKELRSDPLVRNTKKRRRILQTGLERLVGKKWPDDAAFAKDLFSALDLDAVTNFETCQRMIFRPAKGHYLVQSAAVD